MQVHSRDLRIYMFSTSCLISLNEALCNLAGSTDPERTCIYTTVQKSGVGKIFLNVFLKEGTQ